MSEIYYLYGVVPSATDISRAPTGVDGRKVDLMPGDGHAALLSRVEFSEYTPAKIEALAGEVDWVRDRAAAHDRVLNWASDGVVVIPLPMWTLFNTAAAVEKMLGERSGEFAATFERIRESREYTVRVYVKSNELRLHLAEHSADFRTLEARLTGASPGQRYLLERKLDKERKESARRVTREVAAEVYRSLGDASAEAVREEIPAGVGASEQGHAILNSSYLVASAGVVGFQRVLTDLVNRYQPSGFSFAFTGPWPPYHFVGAKGEGGGR